MISGYPVCYPDYEIYDKGNACKGCPVYKLCHNEKIFVVSKVGEDQSK